MVDYLGHRLELDRSYPSILCIGRGAWLWEIRMNKESSTCLEERSGDSVSGFCDRMSLDKNCVCGKSYGITFESSSFDNFYLGELEFCIRGRHDS